MRLLPLILPLLVLHPSFAATGGPDAGDMVYTDSDEAGGPSHVWLDTSAGDAVSLADDATTELALPFAFSFYGTAYDAVTVSSNGVLFFAGATTSATPLCPGSSATWTGIAAYWDDLAAGTVTSATFGVYPWRTFVVSWDDASHATAGGSGRFQVWLLEGRGEAVVVLDDTTFGSPAIDNGITAAVGANSPGAGLDWSCDTAFPDGSTVWFADTSARPARADIQSSELDAPWTGQADFDYAGRSLAVGDANGDGTDDLLVGNQDLDAGVAFLVYRPDLPGSFGEADAEFTGRTSGDLFGQALALADLDGDGYGEIIAGSPYDTSRNGAVYVWSDTSWSGETLSTTADDRWTGGTTGRPSVGWAVSADGDVNGDGYLDLLMGAPTADNGSAVDSGAVYLAWGGSVGAGTVSVSTADAIFTGTSGADQFGRTVHAGDLDSDGYAEIIVAAPFAFGSASASGKAYVIGGAAFATATYAIATTTDCLMTTAGASARLGESIGIGDFDGSGVLDFVLGASTEDTTYTDGGNAYVFIDPVITPGCLPSTSSADTTIAGIASSANAGASVGSGDIDGDGVTDLIVGAPNMSGGASGGGVAYVYTTLPTGTTDADLADHIIGGSGSAAALATAIEVADNVDGSSTLYLGAPYDSVGHSSEGAVYAWSFAPDFEDLDADGFIDFDAGGNDCDDGDATANPLGTDVDGDSVDGDCDGWTDGVIRVRDAAAEFTWDLEQIGASRTTTYDFEGYAEGDTITSYGDIAIGGTLLADDRVSGAWPSGSIGARVSAGTTNAVSFTFPGGVDAVSLDLLDPADTFTLVATDASGTVVPGYSFALSADDRTGGVYRSFIFIDSVTTITLSGATTDSFGLDDLEVAWAVDSDRDLDGYSDAEGDCDDDDAFVSPGASETLGNGTDDDCDGVVDAGSSTTWTEEATWEAAAAIASATAIDFEDIGAGEIVASQYLDRGAYFDGTVTGSTSIDGVAPNDTTGGEAGGADVVIEFEEAQPAIGFTLLAGDDPFTLTCSRGGIVAYTIALTPSSSREFVGMTFDVGVDALVISGSTGELFGIDDLMFSSLGLDDADGDGLTEAEGDCDDDDATAFEGAPDAWYDGVDSDCAGNDDDDQDADGVAVATDCDDTDDTVSPDATDIWYDGEDSNCDGASDYDSDGDGEDDESWGGTDCDDGDGAVNTAATEIWYDGTDSDCGGDDDYDRDGDGFGYDAVLGGTDCDDGDAAVSPDAAETWYDGLDSDCGGEVESDYDQDGDGWDATAWGGDDCEDTEPTAFPGATGETCYDGVDTDCDAGDDNDCDGDGYAWDLYGGEDCDDGDPAVSPDAADPAGDGIDSDCDGALEYDGDFDGFDDVAAGGADCDDSDAAVNPGATDTCYDGVDSDCGSDDDDDCDGDGFASDLYGGTDCDDADGAIRPDADDYPYDGVDQDCDGSSEYDLDGDGHTVTWYGGDDCDDSDPASYLGAADTCYDGVDSDCAGNGDNDCDADGFDADGTGGTDCDDADASISPAATEISGDGVDQDCDGGDETVCTDCDADGFDSGADCDDADPAVNPGAADAWYDGVDADCDGADDYDADADGARASAWGGGDCDDADPTKSPYIATDGCGGGDEDCDGAVDEDCVVVDTGDTGDTADTDTDDTDTDDTDPDTRDTAVDWRPAPDELVEPDAQAKDTGCGCATTPSGTSAAALLLGAALLARRRRG